MPAYVVVLLTLAALYTAFLARELIVPIVLALFFALVGNPIVNGLRHLFLPRWIAALLLVVGGTLAVAYVASLMLGPASEWVRAVPEEIREHLPKLRVLAKPLEEATRATESLEELAAVGTTPTRPALVRVVNPYEQNLVTVLAATPRALAMILAVLILSYFFLAYGDDLLRRFVTQLSTWRRKRLTVDIAHAIRADVSRYMLTITLINIVFGLLAAGGLWLIGIDVYDALFWGAMAGLLNFAPYVGPLVVMVAYALIGLVEFNTLGHALLAPAILLVLHTIEGQFVTPMLLGRTLAISPLILVLWLFIWGWIWGVAGLLLAVPMLVCFKITCERVENLRHWCVMLESGSPSSEERSNA